MSGYSNSRRAPNVSQYIHGLNTIPAPGHELPNDIAHIGDDLDFLAHADFFDFDSFNPNNVEFNTNTNRSPPNGEQKHPSVVNGPPAYQFGEFQTYPSTVSSSPAAGLHGQYPPRPHHQLAFAPQPGSKRKASVANSVPSAADLEENSRMAAEEDKRRRNTAASARFRIKKKQREQALEKATKEMTDKVNALEGKVQQLEMENKWLKGLITDKNDGKQLETMQKETDHRKTDDNTDGVGTFEEATFAA
ncbi:uncharacterized protein LTR77_004419 [Saxophila tyrrhenica]|uniref:BZIP domain-containing protein n=1 Tax=Saxophila tyrrhenica TaxID=1690608 RepID=A0AAV9PH16_9PEZI|nr:hypothetical protein LTR77_004419 [Saxophila tyrrhenica]